MSDDGFWPGVILASIIWVSVLAWLHKEIDQSWKEQIAVHGCGGFYLDENSVRQWDWKESR